MGLGLASCVLGKAYVCVMRLNDLCLLRRSVLSGVGIWGLI